MAHRHLTVLVALRDEPRALSRLLTRCETRGWSPASVRSVSDGTCCEVAMRLRVPLDRRGTDAQLRAQLSRIVGVEHVALDEGEGLPDAVAFAAVRRKAPWACVQARPGGR